MPHLWPIFCFFFWPPLLVSLMTMRWIWIPTGTRSHLYSSYRRCIRPSRCRYMLWACNRLRPRTRFHNSLCLWYTYLRMIFAAVRCTRFVHELRDNADSMYYVGPLICEVDERSGHFLLAIIFRELLVCCHWLVVAHVQFLEFSIPELCLTCMPRKYFTNHLIFWHHCFLSILAHVDKIIYIEAQDEKRMWWVLM